VSNTDAITDLSLSELWDRSRAGARAGFGFRFQAAATAAAAVLCWAERIRGIAVVPEGLDDFTIETGASTVQVQVKSKISDQSAFSASDIAAVLASPARSAVHAVAAGSFSQAVIIDRDFANCTYDNWDEPIANEQTLFDRLAPAVTARTNDAAATERMLAQSTLITWDSPISLGAREIAQRRAVSPAAAQACMHRIMALVARRTDANAAASYEQRAKVTIGDIKREINGTLRLIDDRAINAAVRKGIVEQIDFGTPLIESGYGLGVATQPGHVAAGLTIPRPDVTETIIAAIFRDKRVLVAGPSGAGKSAAALMAAYETRHACRWVQVRRFSSEDREDFQRYLAAQAPSAVSPLILLVDNAGDADKDTWDASLEASLTLANVHFLATAREENLAVLPRRTNFKEIRPVLDDGFAEKMWRQLKADSATTWASWQEPSERSNGLLLEYAHILTQGHRLRGVVSEQVHQRLVEKRDGEFDVLRLTSAAASVGASVSVSLLTDHLGITSAECARALQRLISEHLVRRIGIDEIAGLHELRSQCILDTCLALAPGSVADARREALAVVSSAAARTLVAATLRLGQLDEQGVVTAVVSRLEKAHEPDLLIGALEGLKLAALDRDAVQFKAIAEKHNVAARFYFLILPIMLLNGEKYTGTALEVLAKMRDEFSAQRAHDYRNDLIATLSDGLYTSLLSKIDSLPAALALLRSLAGMELGQKIEALRGLGRTMKGGSLEDIAALLAIAEELSAPLLRDLVEQLGGSDKLLDRLWKETPWAIRPNLIANAEGERELSADLLAVDGLLVTDVDAAVHEYASRALALTPEAARVTSRPVQITGEPITIGGITLGLKSFPRGNSASQATITWNRLLLHAVSLRYAASSTTEVMQRHKELIEIAAPLFSKHADRRCRGRKLTHHDESKLQTLNSLSDFFPHMPLSKPEAELSSTERANLLDSAGDLITDVAPACRRMYDASIDGLIIASDMERVVKAVRSSRSDVRWNYVGGPPAGALDQIEKIAVDLHDIFRSMSAHDGVPSSLVTMPTHQTWAKDTGTGKSVERAQAQAERRIQTLKLSLEQTLSGDDAEVHALSARLRPEGSAHWPDHDICVLIECATSANYFLWLEHRIEALKSRAGTVNSLSIAPLLDGQVIVPCALRILNMGPMPYPEFSKHWSAHLSRSCFTSPTLEAFEEAFSNLLVVNAAQELLQGRPLLDVERRFLDECREKAEKATDGLSIATTAMPTSFMANVLTFVRGLDETFTNTRLDTPGARPAVETACEVAPSFDGLASETKLAVLQIRLALIQLDFDRLLPRAA
jgi:hypothetical protein